MLLTKVHIQNFRGIADLSIPFGPYVVLIGANNAGKSSVLDAIRYCLTRTLSRKTRAFEDYDYRVTTAAADPTQAPPILIELTFSEQIGDEWPEEISQLMEGAEQLDGAGLRHVILRITSGYEALIKDFSTDYDFLDLAGNALPKGKVNRALANLQQLVPTFYLASLRDAANEFRSRGQFWAPFVRSLDMTPEEQSEIEAELATLNQLVLDKHTNFAMIREHLAKAASIMGMRAQHPITIDALPSKASEILNRTQVSIVSNSGAAIPISRHGSGTQSLAVIGLFDAFLRSQLELSYTAVSQPLLTLEEPEAHLFPAATKSVGELLKALGGQKIISTHSGDLIAGSQLADLRRLRRDGDSVSVHFLAPGDLSADDVRKLDYHIRLTRGSLLFSKCWLMVEGETEAPLLIECAAAMDLDLFSEGVSLIEYAQVGLEPFLKLANALGMEWVVLTDGDSAGQTYAAQAQARLGGKAAATHLCSLPHANMEMYLCQSGYGQIYEANISPQKQHVVVSAQGTQSYWEEVLKAQKAKSKPRMALAVAEAIRAAGVAAVPVDLRTMIENAIELARNS
ncbi:MAG: putative ATP-dependent endonuclease of the family [Sphingomonadales bacterium]|jgi:putative ATP-dependent endonuclease of OLD family|nr:putative ATP-dependent endonuclease of the family [Sphingomonadales bacterium]